MPEQLPTDLELVYRDDQRSVEGVFLPLVNQLSTEIQFDRVQVEYDRQTPKNSDPWNRRCALALRRGIYRVLKINMVREVGRTIVRLHIMEQKDVRQTLVICREHFDAWFGTAPEGEPQRRRDAEEDGK